MSRRLGEILADEGVLTEDQLQRAITDQLVFGGHLGTSILELGFLDERTLGAALARTMGLSYSDRDALTAIPYDVVQAVPARLAEKHKVIPLRIDRKNLHLAMIDPTNLLALDEISFVTGFKIIPSVALEVRVLEMLESYYGLARSQRFMMLAQDLNQRAIVPSIPYASGRRQADRLAGKTATGSLHESSERSAEATPVFAPAAATQIAEPPAAHALDRPQTAFGDASTNRLQINAALAGLSSDRETLWSDGGPVHPSRSQGMNGDDHDDTVLDEDTRPQPRRVGTEPSADVTLIGAAARRLADARRVDDVFATVLSYAAARLPRCMVFVPKARDAVLWTARGNDVADRDLNGVRVPLEDSIFALIDGRDPYYVGAPPRRRGILGFYELMGLPLPKTVVVVPIFVQERVAAYLYADGGSQEILALDIPSVQSLCARAGFALQVLILRNKILAD
jgi:hypothetical protein